VVGLVRRQASTQKSWTPGLLQCEADIFSQLWALVVHLLKPGPASHVSQMKGQYKRRTNQLEQRTTTGCGHAHWALLSVASCSAACDGVHHTHQVQGTPGTPHACGEGCTSKLWPEPWGIILDHQCKHCTQRVQGTPWGARDAAQLWRRSHNNVSCTARSVCSVCSTLFAVLVVAPG
jgi:hypothetical protein